MGTDHYGGVDGVKLIVVIAIILGIVLLVKL